MSVKYNMTFQPAHEQTRLDIFYNFTRRKPISVQKTRQKKYQFEDFDTI